MLGGGEEIGSMEEKRGWGADVNFRSIGEGHRMTQ